MGFEKSFVVEPNGRSGGLVMLWKEEVNASVNSYCQNHIDLVISIEGKTAWRLTGFYGLLERAKRRESWELLKAICNSCSLPWVVLGDFNEILSNDELSSPNERENWMLRGFREAIDYCGLVDIRFIGPQFTWTGIRNGVVAIEERLDRAFANPAWLTIFSKALVRNIVSSTSDHLPILLQLDGIMIKGGRRTKKRFRFEDFWLRDDDCEIVVADGGKGEVSNGVIGRIKKVSAYLLRWSDSIFGDLRRKIEEEQLKLEKLRNIPKEQRDLNEYRDQCALVNKLLQEESMFWRRRSRETVIRDNDRNT
ncbi:unnamed protein product [Amaranthus hypochondriacus]